MGERWPQSARVVKRTGFSSHGEILGQNQRIRPEHALSGSLRAEKSHLPRGITAISVL